MRLLSYHNGIMTNLDGGAKTLSVPTYGGRRRRGRPKKSAAVQPADKLQIEIVRYLDLVCPHCFIFCTDNAGNHVKYDWETRLAMGLKTGLPGICLLAPTSGGAKWEPHFIRAAILGHINTPAEEGCQMKLIHLGVRQATCTCIAEVTDALSFWQIQTRDIRVT